MIGAFFRHQRGVIDTKTLLSALVEIGYDGPVRAEPFKRDLSAFSREEAVANR